jgi:ribosomal protein S12 methylthiotransferase accessory factor
LHPLPPREPARGQVEDDAGRALQSIVARLETMGLETFVLDLTKPAFGIPVARIIVPGLQLEPSEIVGERLAKARRETGGGEDHTGAVALL